jgi:hypothetical protein
LAAPEITEPHAAVRMEENIRRFDVEMRYSRTVAARKSVENLLRNLAEVPETERPMLLDALRESDARAILKH